MYQESKAFFVFHHLHCCLTTGQSVRTRSHIKKLWVCPSLSLTWILLFLSIWCDCSLKPVWWTVRALVSKSLCHLARWLWEGPYPASIAQRFKARRVGEDQRERERHGARWRRSFVEDQSDPLDWWMPTFRGPWDQMHQICRHSPLWLSGTICYDVCRHTVVWWWSCFRLRGERAGCHVMFRKWQLDIFHWCCFLDEYGGVTLCIMTKAILIYDSQSDKQNLAHRE